MGSLWVVGERAGMISKHVLVCCLGKGKHQKMLQQRDLGSVWMELIAEN